MKAAPTFKPRQVNGGPLLDNVLEGNAVDLQKHSDADLARARRRPFIGTACMVIMKDPDSGWVN